MTFVLIGIVIMIAGCVNERMGPYNMMSQEYGWHEPGFMYPEQFDPSLDSNIVTEFESNGQMIYYTGYNENEEQIPVNSGPHWLYVHGGSCVSCHGVSGRGGVPIMMGTVVPSDITYETLTAEEGQVDEHEEHPPYTDETIKIAIREGKDPSGEDLDTTMPKWDMSDADIEDLIDYLKTL
ncbi:cytochrome c [Methanococcoides sp. SA1]|nr:cytochrome c [Methanococcoides sp. SA1]